MLCAYGTVTTLCNVYRRIDFYVRRERERNKEIDVRRQKKTMTKFRITGITAIELQYSDDSVHFEHRFIVRSDYFTGKNYLRTFDFELTVSGGAKLRC